MQVRILSNYAGPLGTWAPGDVADLSADEVRGLVAAGYGAPVDQSLNAALGVQPEQNDVTTPRSRRQSGIALTATSTTDEGAPTE